MHKKLPHYFLTVLSLLAISACGGSGGSGNVITTIPYAISEAGVSSSTHPRVLIASVNVGKPSRKFLRLYEPRVDEFVRQYLKQAGFQIVATALFDDEWQTAVRRYGNPVNPTTGKINEKSFAKVLQYVFAQLKERGSIDAVIFTDLIEREVSYGTSVNRVARWDGVSRKLSTQGPGSGVPGDFNWAQGVEAVSLWVNIFDMDLEALFQSGGGIEVTQALSLKSTPKFVRRRSLLANRRHLEEGIALAFHPVVTMKNYPGLPPQVEPAKEAD